MGFSLPIYLLAATCAYFIVSSSSQSDRLTPGTTLSVDQKLISSGGIFALGFFSPTNSTTNRYVGIWYNNISEKIVVWVANREAPLTDPSGVLIITRDGNIALLEGNGSRTLWSSNISNTNKIASAVLMDTGNLILTSESGNFIWQSFDHPTDTILPGMKLRYSSTTGTSQHLVAWRSPTDPSPGDVSLGLDPDSPLQIVLRKGNQILWRYGSWTGKLANAVGTLNVSLLYIETFVLNDEGVYYMYTTTDEYALIRLFLEPSGILNSSSLEQNQNGWVNGDYVPRWPCDVYNRCGRFGSCSRNVSDKVCECLTGFEPMNQMEWSNGNFTGGCARRAPLSCRGEDKFVMISGIKFPDKFVFLRNKNDIECEDECSRNCSCTAYAFINMTVHTADLRCFLWHGDLKDMVLDSTNGGTLFVRVASSELTVQVAGSSRKINKSLPFAMVSTAIVLILVSVLSFICLRKKQEIKDCRSGRKYSDIIESVNIENDVTELPLLEFGVLAAATNNFSMENKLGEGGFGPVYKGELKDGQVIALKRLSKNSRQGFEEFKNEIQLIAKLQHTNLVRLLGWCAYRDEKILVYEYLPNKSLDSFIFDPEKSIMLNWSIRYKIIEGIAQGLLYLHGYSRLRIIHRDLKTSNILLDSSMNPKISDFGLARIFDGNQKEANTQRIVGTYGYISPEYAYDGVFSEKSDVFSFGVIVLEIITGKKSIGYYPYKESEILLGYAWQLWEEGKIRELVDPSIGGEFPEEEVKKCLQVGLLSIQENAADRPPMSSIVLMLNNVSEELPKPKWPAFAIRSRANASENLADASTDRETKSLSLWASTGSKDTIHCVNNTF